MRKTAICTMVIIIGLSAFAHKIENKFPQNKSFWYTQTTKKTQNDNLIKIKNMQEDINNDNEHKIKLNSDFEFIHNEKLIGVDNGNFKYYEIISENDNYSEKELSYEETEKIFSELEVIKISDFKKGTYTIIAHGEEKEILIYNDTNESFENYTIKNNKEDTINNKIKCLIKLPCRGKITICNGEDKNAKRYVIKVR